MVPLKCWEKASILSFNSKSGSIYQLYINFLICNFLQEPKANFRVYLVTLSYPRKQVLQLTQCIEASTLQQQV